MSTLSILIVEDDHDSMLGLAERLKAEGYRTPVAVDGPSAVRAVQAEHPDAIILDLALPSQDGFSVMKRLRQVPETAGIPIIVLSGRSEHVAKQAALDHGARAYFQKPADNVALLATLRACVEAGVAS